MILDEHGKVVVGTHDVVTLDEPATKTQQETNEITQEESEETNQSVEEKFQQFSPDNLPTLEGYLKIMRTTNKFWIENCFHNKKR